jgi:DNA mismatch repair protein MutL
VSEAFTRVALAHPSIHFTLKHNDRVIHELPAVESWRSRIESFFGAELRDGLIHVSSEDGEVRLSGFVADPEFSRGNNRMQYVFLNGRYIRDRSLQHALGEAYRGLLLTGRYPITFLRLEMPPEAVDVNVHPAKLEVRFQEGGRLYSQLLGTIRNRFLTTDLTAKVQSSSSPDTDESAAAHDATSAEQHRRQLVDWAKGQIPDTSDRKAAPAAQADLDYRFERPNAAAVGWEARTPRESEGTSGFAQVAGQNPMAADALPASSASDVAPMRPSASALQVQNRYLITEVENGVVIIDQHALHERILYEQLREKVLSGDMETQRLLVPEPVSLTAAEASAALEAKELLAQLGIEIEHFGGDTVIVSAYPAMLANLGPAEMLRQVVDQLMADGKQPDRRDVLDELLHMISCKAAIKAGDRLQPEEITALLEHRELCQDSHHCPHGRPTSLVFTREELDRRFKRT